MATKTDRQRSSPQYSTTHFWIGLLTALLLLAILLESVCLGILYVNDSLKGNNTSRFAEKHLLTELFVSTQPNPVPGKHFLGRLTWGDAGWGTPYVADSLLGYRMRSAISFFYVAPSDEYLYITDDNGFSVDVDDPPITVQKPADAYRIIVLGGSTVMGAGAPRPSQNIVGMLRKGVRARGLTGPNGKHIEFINAGVDGYTSAQEYLYLVSDLLRFKPDLVVVYDGWNDLVYDSSLSPFRTTHVYIRSRIPESFSIAGSVFLVAQNIRGFLTSISLRLGMVELPRRVFDRFRPRADIIHSSYTPYDPRNIEFYAINRRAFLALADNQLSVALFLQPLVGVDDRMLSAQEKASWWYRTHDKVLVNRDRGAFYERARQILAHLKARDQGNGHHCIADLSHSLKGVSEPVYADTGHLLPKGNEVVAAQILDQLVLCGLLD